MKEKKQQQFEELFQNRFATGTCDLGVPTKNKVTHYTFLSRSHVKSGAEVNVLRADNLLS